MELRHLRSFLAVAEHLSFSKAAAALHLTQPALSRQIRDLEEEVGCRLFDRRPTEIGLTADGEFLREHAGKLVRAADDLGRTMQVRGRGATVPVRVAHFGTFLALYLAPFLQRVQRPAARCHVELVELDPAVALQRLARGELDAAVSGRPDPRLLSGLESRVIWNRGPLVALPAAHALAKRRQIRLRDLAGERLLAWDEGRFPGFGEPFLAGCRAAGFVPQVSRTVTDIAEVISAVPREGVVGYVGRLVGQLPAPGVALIPLAEGEVDMPTLLIWRPDSPGASLLRELAALVAAQPPAQ